MITFFRWLGKPRKIGSTVQGPEPFPARLHIPRSLHRQLLAFATPSDVRAEPLALVDVRYASESAKNVVVAVHVMPVPIEAYVDGPDGANFDTRWLMHLANHKLESNAGLLLSHSHGGYGKPTFSRVDRRTNEEVFAKFAIGVETAPYGSLLLSTDDVVAVVTVGDRLVHAEVVIIPDADDQQGILAC